MATYFQQITTSIGAEFLAIPTLGTLALFRRIEDKMPATFYAHYHISFNRDNVMAGENIRGLLKKYDFIVNNMRYRTSGDGHIFDIAW